MNKYFSRFLTIICLLVVPALGLSLSVSAVELNYYLPMAESYDAKIATPEKELGYQIGEWHVRPEQVERYLFKLAEQSPRVKVEIIGYTYEKRPLIHAYFSSPENIARLESIRQQHLKKPDDTNIPLVTWMGYSVHGNEASGSNASLLLAYHLAAANDETTLAQLRDQVIIIDPMVNPDGLARFAHWVNSHKSQVLNPDPENIEHNEAWPSGRTNHYWFDLNRDWLLLQHPESNARVSQFQRWRPNILTDFHEMGTNGTYFFQPGAPSRQNPLTPDANFKMTATIAEQHAKSLDALGSLYYSKEDFDDFYFGKGSTYPDIHGSVGILFEQASARGHLQESSHGDLSFPFAIRNHLTTSLSTLRAAEQNRKNLKKMQADFNTQTAELAKNNSDRAVVIGSKDAYRLAEMKRILDGHHIDYYPLAKDLSLRKQKFNADESLIIPLQQPQYRLINAMFETRTEFKDKIFYDVSAWNFALALDLDYAFLSRADYSRGLLGDQKGEPSKVATLNADSLALAFDWSNFSVARLLSEMLQFELRVQVVTQPTQLKTEKGNLNLSLGSVVLPLANQVKSRKQIIEWLKPRLHTLNISPIEIKSGLAVQGVDMGSPSLPVIKPVKPLLIIGEGVSGYAAGEVWHLLDQRLSQPLTMMTSKQLAKLSQIDYTHLILVDGKPDFDKDLTEKMADWVKQGGVIIAHSGGAKWLVSQDWTSSEVKKFDKPVDVHARYADKGQIDAEHYVGGAITLANIDTSHPLGFGLDDQNLAVFKRGELVFSEPREAFVSIAHFTDKPLLTGYMSPAIQEHLADSASIIVQALGKGRLIAFSDDPVFRGYWLGGARVFTNALYFAKAIEASAKSKASEKEGSKK